MNKIRTPNKFCNVYCVDVYRVWRLWDVCRAHFALARTQMPQNLVTGLIGTTRHIYINTPQHQPLQHPSRNATNRHVSRQNFDRTPRRLPRKVVKIRRRHPGAVHRSATTPRRRPTHRSRGTGDVGGIIAIKSASPSVIGGRGSPDGWTTSQNNR